MEVKIKLLEGGRMPEKKTSGAAAFDCYARWCDGLNEAGEIEEDNPEEITMLKYSLGFALEVPEGYCVKIIPRSSVVNTSLRLANNIGLIDSDYRGEISAVFDIIKDSNQEPYELDDRICQLLIEKVEDVQLIEAQELSDTDRGSGGYGSTGR